MRKICRQNRTLAVDMKGNFYPHELINVYNDKYLLLEMNQNLMFCCDRREVQEF
jgi:hypothetical protein